MQVGLWAAEAATLGPGLYLKVSPLPMERGKFSASDVWVLQRRSLWTGTCKQAVCLPCPTQCFTGQCYPIRGNQSITVQYIDAPFSIISECRLLFTFALSASSSTRPSPSYLIPRPSARAAKHAALLNALRQLRDEYRIERRLQQVGILLEERPLSIRRTTNQAQRRANSTRTAPRRQLEACFFDYFCWSAAREGKLLVKSQLDRAVQALKRRAEAIGGHLEPDESSAERGEATAGAVRSLDNGRKRFRRPGLEGVRQSSRTGIWGRT